MKGRGSSRALGVLLFALSGNAGAQESGKADRTLIFGATASGFIGPYPADGILGLGGLVGVEQKLSNGITARAFASVQRGVATADDVSICRPDGLDGCLPDPLLPHWLSSVELNALVALVPRFPLKVVVGLGFAIAGDARRTIRSARRTSAPTETPLVFRRGLEIPLGSSPRAVRVQYTRSDFRPDAFSLKRVDALTILMRP